MQSHGTGALRGTRQGSYPVRHSASIKRGENVAWTTVNTKLFTVDGTAANPVAYRVSLVVGTAFNPTGTATTALGTSSGGTQLLTASNVKAAAGTNYAPAAAADIKIATSAVDIWASTVVSAHGSEFTAGEVFVILELFEINLKATSEQGD